MSKNTNNQEALELKKALINFIIKNSEEDQEDLKTTKLDDLVNFDIDTGEEIKYGFTYNIPVLSALIKKGEFDLAKRTIEAGANVNQKDTHNNTPLYHTSMHGLKAKELINLLISKGADTTSFAVENEDDCEIFDVKKGDKNAFLAYLNEHSNLIGEASDQSDGEG
jgi:ankyrin repeat protein